MEEPSNNNSSSSNHSLPEVKFTKLFINGEFADAISGATFETIDPRTGHVSATIAEGDERDVDLAVKAARHAFDNGAWPRLSGSERGRIMMKFADLIEQNNEEIAALDVLNGGKLFTLAKYGEIPGTAKILRYYAGAADKIHGEVLKMSSPLHGYTLLEPIGVAGIIVPWNFPSILLFYKVAPALAAGCTMVIKPSELTPLSALFYAQLAKQAGVPDGVFNVVTGPGSTGQAIASHMDVDMVAFTGSTEVGRKVMQAAAQSNLKPVSLELGGKSPVIVFDDADVEMAAELALYGVFFNKGEICAAGSRVYVQEGIYDNFVEKLCAKSKEWVMGDPFNPSSRVGPLVSKKQLDRVLGLIEQGKKEGATVLTGGKRGGGEGYYLEPTVFTDVTDDMVISQEEIFAPVVAVAKFKTMEEVIKRANGTRYGLAAGIVTRSLDVANTVSRSIRAGIIWINCYLAFDNDCPFGGYKMSGFGRESGMQGLYRFLQLKSVVTPIHNSPWL